MSKKSIFQNSLVQTSKLNFEGILMSNPCPLYHSHALKCQTLIEIDFNQCAYNINKTEKTLSLKRLLKHD